jgi:hypothetical protein
LSLGKKQVLSRARLMGHFSQDDKSSA